MYDSSDPIDPRISATALPRQFAPADARYIKLGAGGAWADDAFARGIMPIGFREVPHQLCQAGDWDAVKAHLRRSYQASTSTHWTRELHDFYEQDERCLWFTIANGHVYWAFTASKVIATENGMAGEPQRHRQTIDGWHRCDLNGVALTTRSLSSALLRTTAYQMTICSVAKKDYLFRRIRGERDPLHVEGTALQAKMASLAEAMIGQLDWRDFEILTDLIFARGGWQRSSAIGDGEVNNDLLLTMPTTGEIAWVQVKSQATQAILDDYLTRFDCDGSCQRFFFVCHTAKGKLAVPERSGLHLWTGLTLAHATIAAGLFDWLVDQTR